MWQVILIASIVAGTWHLVRGKKENLVEVFLVICAVGAFGFAAGIERRESDMLRVHIELPEQECTGARFTESGKC